VEIATMANDLDEIRGRLDEVDERLLDALADRQRLIERVARLKQQGAISVIRDPAREEDMLTRLVQRGRAAGLDGYFVTRIYREILDQSLRLQHEYLVSGQDPARPAEQPVVVAYQGTEGAYSHLAASRYFGAHTAEVRFRGYDSFPGMLRAVEDGDAAYAVLPIENTTAGSINEAYDLLLHMDLALVGEEIQSVEHCLLALEDVPVTHIRRVYSHPQALAQCSRFLATLEHCHVESFTDTAMAVKKVRDDQDLSQAAVASEEAGRLYGLRVIKENIANQRENFTRMFIVAQEPRRYDLRIPCKTSLIFATRHEEGALLACLNILASYHLNLTKLESRPRPNNPWEYLFYVDFEGNSADPQVETALGELAAKTSFLRVLGSYPARTTKDSRPAEPRPTVLDPAASAGGPSAPPVSPPPPPPQVLERKPYRLVSRAHRAEDTVVAVGTVAFGDSGPVLVAGPGWVESAAQLAACSRAIKDAGGQVLRGRCFRPETADVEGPGLGFEGLDLLEEAGAALDLPVVTAVSHPADVAAVAAKMALIEVEPGDMQNYPLLRQLGRVDRPVLLKRGIMADIDEWLSAAEFILSQGNQQVILCECGIRTFETATRTTLDLSAVPVVRERTHLPVLVDPSYACGNWRWIPALAESAVAAGAHGVVLEVRVDAEGEGAGPAESWHHTTALPLDQLEPLAARLRGR
jgi:chorismate mutase/prephenate dehydratase